MTFWIGLIATVVGGFSAGARDNDYEVPYSQLIMLGCGIALLIWGHLA